MMRPRTRAESASVKVVQPPRTTTREGRRASSGVLAATGRIDREWKSPPRRSEFDSVCSVRTYLPSFISVSFSLCSSHFLCLSGKSNEIPFRSRTRPLACLPASASPWFNCFATATASSPTKFRQKVLYNITRAVEKDGKKERK